MSKIIHWTYTCKGGSEDHFINDEIQPKYYEWRDSIWNCSNPIRYPVGFQRKNTVLFSIDDNGVRYNYIDARINIYVKKYMTLIRNIPIYYSLLEKLKNGENLCITEVDLPSKDKKGLYSRVDEDGFFVPTLENLTELLYDSSTSFGHGLCLAAALLENL